MTNKERQASLDRQNWSLSQRVGKDMSGDMPYCVHCEFSRRTISVGDYVCDLTDEHRVKYCACATAYNRMTRRRTK